MICRTVSNSLSRLFARVSGVRSLAAAIVTLNALMSAATLMATGPAQAAVDRPDATPAPAWVQSPAPFAWRADLPNADRPGLYRVPIPLQVYESAKDPSLSDVRIYNGQGVAMPYAWLAREDEAGATAHDVAVPVFALKGSGRQDVAQRMALSVKRGADQHIQSVSVDGAAGRGSVEIGSLFDLSGVNGVVQALLFEDYETDTRVHAFSLEASDDLSTWRTLRQEAHIVRLARDGQVVQQNRVELAPLAPGSATYLRLRWHHPESAPNLVKVAVRVDPTPAAPRNFIWTEPQAPVAGSDRDFEFQAPAALPIERLRVNLPRANLMAPVRVYAYDESVAGSADAAAKAPVGSASGVAGAGTSNGAGAPTPTTATRPDAWILRAHAVLYRMQADVGEIVSPDVLLPGEPMKRFRVILDATERLGGTPTVQIGFVPRSLIVATQGPGPFTMAWGATGLQDQSQPLSALAPGRAGSDLVGALDTLYAQRREPATGMTIAVPAGRTADQASKRSGEGASAFGDTLFTLLLVLIDIGLGALAPSPERLDA
ncbi:MAG: DUF3999 family protein [Comamonadaceae bacterium]|nr:MAG: DUF3999 family protein [Comamonadaceae bacterium]